MEMQTEFVIGTRSHTNRKCWRVAVSVALTANVEDLSEWERLACNPPAIATADDGQTRLSQLLDRGKTLDAELQRLGIKPEHLRGQEFPEVAR